MRQVSFWPRLWERFCLSPGVAGYGSPQQLLHVRSLQRAGQREATSVLPQVARRAQAARQVAASEVVYADYVSSAFCYRTDCPDSPARPAPWPLQRSVDPPAAHARAATPCAGLGAAGRGGRRRARAERGAGGRRAAGRLAAGGDAAAPAARGTPAARQRTAQPDNALAPVLGCCSSGGLIEGLATAAGRHRKLCCKRARAPRRQRRGPGRTPSAPWRRPRSGCTRRRASS
jgi:hypothetical protein